ncbi:hypothetical protein ACWKWA_10630 [Dermacoccus abyssi]
MIADRPTVHTHEARPTVREVLHSVLLRAVLPALVMFGLLLGVGKALMTVFHEVPSESASGRRWPQSVTACSTA